MGCSHGGTLHASALGMTFLSSKSLGLAWASYYATWQASEPRGHECF